MALILINGISTSGKSTVAMKLLSRGYEAYDTEHNGISAWHNKFSGKRAAEFGQVPERTEAWLDQHEWLVSIEWVQQIAQKAITKNIYVCGGGANENKVRALCDKVIWLSTNSKTIINRVNNPRDHTYGTKAHELKLILLENKLKEKEHREFGAIIIDATRPIDVVVKQILELSI